MGSVKESMENFNLNRARASVTQREGTDGCYRAIEHTDSAVFACEKTCMPVRLVLQSSTQCGYRQVVRHQLPKLASAGSNPVTRSIAEYGLLAGPFISAVSSAGRAGDF